jgi:uncharacterized protein (UPF0335 family)
MTIINILIIVIIVTSAIAVLWHSIVIIKAMKKQLNQVTALADRLQIENSQIKETLKTIISGDLQEFMNDLQSKGFLDERLMPLLEILKKEGSNNK